MTKVALRARSARWAGGAFRRSAGFVALMALPFASQAQQIRSSVVLGGVRVRYAEAVDLDAITLSPAVTLQSGANVLGLTSTISRPTVGSWSAQAMLSGAAFKLIGRRFAAEVGANAGGSTSGDGARTGSAQGLVRAHALVDWWGAWAGVGAGSSWDGAAWRPTQVGELGAWAQWNAYGATLSWSPITANDSVRYADALLSLRWRGRRVELDGTLGHRDAASLALTGSGPVDWASASASYRMSDRFAIVVGAGTYPLDLLQGFPSGRFASLGVRLTGPGSGPSPEFARGTEEVRRDRLARTGVSALKVRRLSAGRFELRVRASGASTIELTGDLTGWEATSMRAEPDGWWVLVLDGDPGTYEFTVRRDGGAWLVPPGTVERRDEFGGVSGVLRLR